MQTEIQTKPAIPEPRPARHPEAVASEAEASAAAVREEDVVAVLEAGKFRVKINVYRRSLFV